ncbi:MAG: hypothetical protein HGA96_03630 [Desulfobulbaceae bacterium]|nr:hypothetical protein [Desulfobulbaceae bacterium]
MNAPSPKSGGAKFPPNFSRLRELGDNKPRLRFGYLSPLPAAGSIRLVLPFRRSWLLIGIVGIFLAIFAAPLVGIIRQANPRGDNLFSLVATLFQLFWGLGWSVGVGVIALIFLALLLGREVVVIRADALLIRLELFGFGVGGEYAAQGIRNLRPAQPDAANGTSWRGAHLAFDYYGVPVGFGSDLDGPRSSEILQLVRNNLQLPLGEAAVSGEARPAAPAVAEDVAAGWDSREPAVPAGTPPGITATTGWKDNLGSPSTLALLLANLVPLAGVYLLGWDIGEIMLLYWAESGIIGFFNLLKMAVVGRWATLFLGPFFVGHYGAFMAAHLLFIYTFFVQGLPGKGDIVVAEVVAKFTALWPALLALAVSHGISFLVNFLGRREFAGTTVQKQMAEPYSRIIIMHLTIIFGGFVVMGLGSSLPALLLLMVAKIGVDLRAHGRQRSLLAHD